MAYYVPHKILYKKRGQKCDIELKDVFYQYHELDKSHCIVVEEIRQTGSYHYQTDLFSFRTRTAQVPPQKFSLKTYIDKRSNKTYTISGGQEYWHKYGNNDYHVSIPNLCDPTQKKVHKNHRRL